MTPSGVHRASGNTTSSWGNGVTTNATTNSTTNYVAPAQITTNLLSSNMNWTGFLGLSSAAGPNGDTAFFGYESGGRPPTRPRVGAACPRVQAVAILAACAPVYFFNL